jgi:hypothetical protein
VKILTTKTIRVDPQEALYNIADRSVEKHTGKQIATTDVGSVTSSLIMLTAIPEVDLGDGVKGKSLVTTKNI